METITLAQAMKRYFGTLDWETWHGLGLVERSDLRKELELELDVKIVYQED